MLQGRQAFRLDVNKEYHCRDVFSRQVDLVYDRQTLERKQKRKIKIKRKKEDKVNNTKVKCTRKW